MTGSRSSITISTDDAVPARTPAGRGLPSRTVKVSSSGSASRVVSIVPDPIVAPAAITTSSSVS